MWYTLDLILFEAMSLCYPALLKSRVNTIVNSYIIYFKISILKIVECAVLAELSPYLQLNDRLLDNLLSGYKVMYSMQTALPCNL